MSDVLTVCASSRNREHQRRRYENCFEQSLSVHYRFPHSLTPVSACRVPTGPALGVRRSSSRQAASAEPSVVRIQRAQPCPAADDPSAERRAPSAESPSADAKIRWSMPVVKLHKTVGVRVGAVQVGGGAPVVVQSMTMTDTADRSGDGRSSASSWPRPAPRWCASPSTCPKRPQPCPEIKQRMLDAGVTAPLIGDFHYNGHLLLTRYPDCARGARQVPDQSGQRRHRQAARRAVRHDLQGRRAINGKPVRIGVNGGSLNQELVVSQMQENTDRDLGLTSEEIINECMVLSAVQSTELALESGLRKDQIIISCKTSRPRDLIAVYRDLSRKTDQPLHLGLTEAGMGTKGLVWSAVVDGRAAERRDRRHDPRLADAAAGRRPARGSLRGVRAAAGARPADVLAERDRLPRAAAERRAARSRSWPSGRRITSASGCRSGRRSTRVSKR